MFHYFFINNLLSNLPTKVNVKNRIHSHISLSDVKGNYFGGHLDDKGKIIFTTAEIIIDELLEMNFTSE